jgi:pimeloyl-ACP methyl ester carboxylesterase
MAQDALEAAPPSFIAMGFSLGGIVALHLAPIAGERLKGLILLDTNPGADTSERRLMRERQQRAVEYGLLPQVVREELKPHYLAAENRGRADLLDLTMEMALACGPAVFVNQAEALKTRPDAWGVLPALNVPVLVLCGAEDELCPPAMHERMCRECRDGTLSIVGGAGHLLPLEQPVAASSAIMAWAERHFTGDADG